MAAKTKLQTYYKVILITVESEIPIGWDNKPVLRLVEMKDSLTEEDALQFIEDQDDYGKYQILPYITRVVDFED